MGRVIPIRVWRHDPDPIFADLLNALTGVESVAVHELNDLVNPRPGGGPGVDGRTRAGKAWRLRCLAVHEAVVDLMDAGLTRIAREGDGTRPWELAITEAGRQWLASPAGAR